MALRLGGVGLVALVVFVYWPAMWGDFVRFDDYTYVYRNPDVLRGLTRDGFSWAFTSLRASNWHPLTWLSLMLDAEIFGVSAPGYHIMNVALHAANVLLFLTLLHTATGRLLPALAAALLFAVHPLHVESVAWISERKDVLSTFFWLACMLAYTRYAARLSAWRYAACLGLFCLGLMAKPMLVTLPCVLLLFDYWPLRRFGTGQAGERFLWGLPLPGRRLLLEKLPFLAAAAATCWATVVAQADSMSGLGYLPPWARLLNAGTAYLAYLGKTVLPLGLAPFYPHPYTDVSVWGGVAGLLAVVAASTLAWRQAGQRPYLFTGWFWFVGTLVPVIGLVQVGSQAWADRYAYVPHLGLFLALVWGGRELAGRLRLRPWGAAGAVLALAAWFGALAHGQASLWVDTQTLFTHTVQVTERNGLAEFLLAAEARGREDWPAYYRHYQRAVDYSPYAVSAKHTESGRFYLVYSQFKRAQEQLLQALEIYPDNPYALRYLATLYAYTGRFSQALAALDRAEAVTPRLRGLEKSRANVLKLQEAMRRRVQEGANATAPDSGVEQSAAVAVPEMD